MFELLGVITIQETRFNSKDTDKSKNIPPHCYGQQVYSNNRHSQMLIHRFHSQKKANSGLALLVFLQDVKSKPSSSRLAI